MHYDIQYVQEYENALPLLIRSVLFAFITIQTAFELVSLLMMGNIMPARVSRCLFLLCIHTN